MTDWPGIITACGIFAVACANAWNIFVQSPRRDKKVAAVVAAVATSKMEMHEVSKKMDTTHDLVNSKSEEILKLAREISFAAGEKAGEAKQRAQPTKVVSTKKSHNKPQR